MTDTRAAAEEAAVEPARLAALHSRTGAAVIAATVLSSLVGFLDASVVNVAVPAIGRDLGAGVESLQWTLTGYLLTVAALLLVSGGLADRFGRRRVVVSGLLVMLVAAAVCAVAPSVGVLIAARVVQGVGGALVVPNSLALLNGTLRKSDRARGIGLWAGLASLATTGGPYAGGWLVDHASWRWVFLLNVPVVLAALLVLQHVPEQAGARGPRSIDVVGGLLAAVGLGGVIYGLSAGSSAGWASVRVLLPGVIGVLALIALLPVERRVRAPMVKLSLFASRQFDAINMTTVLFYGALSAVGYLVVLECELRLDYSATRAGAALIPYSIVFLTVSPVSGALVARFGPRWLMTSGILTVAAGFVWLSSVDAGSSYARGVLPGVLLWGLGIGLCVTPLTAAVLAAVRDDDLGEASAINDASSRIGGVIAIAVVPLLLGAGGGHSFAAALTDGYRPAMLVLSGSCVLAAVVTAVFVSDERATPPRLAPTAPCHGCALPVPDRRYP